MKYSDPNHPEHIPWLIARRKRFLVILKEASILRLFDEEKEMLRQFRKMIRLNTEQLEIKNDEHTIS